MNNPQTYLPEKLPRRLISPSLPLLAQLLLILAALACFLPSKAMAASSEEQMQQALRQLGIKPHATSVTNSKQEHVLKLMQTNSIPQWEKARDQMRWLRLNPPNAAAAETWKSLDTETSFYTGIAPLTKATTPRDSKHLFDLSSWLRWSILSENADGRYSYAYALNLHRMRDENGNFNREAAVFFFHARLALKIDGARCADKSSVESIAAGYETQRNIQPLIEQISQMFLKERAIVLLEAVSLEEVRGERPILSYLCASGGQTILKAINLGRQSGETSPNTSHLGNTYSIDTSEIEPEVLPDDQWQKKRREILDDHIRSAINALNNN